MSWAARQERGGSRLTGAALALALHARPLADMLVWPAAVWALLTDRTARAASREYLRRVTGRPAGWGGTVRHFAAFGHAVLDRVQLLGGAAGRFTLRTEGADLLCAVLAQGRGCILLGAHLGSFEALRAAARDSPVPVWALMYRGNGGALTALLDRLNPALRERVIEIGGTASLLRARECIERGEVVGILADRVPPGSRCVSVPFLGGRASFPAGPFVLAGSLGAPVLLFSAVRTGRGCYTIRFQPFAERVALRRAHRADDLAQAIARYAAALEPLCRAHPLQWFNFFPFWESAPHAHPDPAPAAGAAAAAALATQGPG